MQTHSLTQLTTKNKKPKQEKSLILKLKPLQKDRKEENKDQKKAVTFSDDTPKTTNSRKSKVCCIYKLGKNKKKNKYERID